jgi:hypothetical protein
MTGRSYLRRIAQPLAPGDARLMPMRMPLPGEARPRVVDAATGPPGTAEGREIFGPVVAAPEAEKQRAAALPDLPQDAAPAPEAGPAAEPPAGDVAGRGGRAQERAEPVPPARGPVTRVGPKMRDDAQEVVRWERPTPRRAEPEQEQPALRIGTIEVRVQPAPAPAAPPPSQSGEPSPPARAPSGPLARGLTWRYGLVQG